MAKIRDVAAYICETYPHKHELSKARLTKLVYLADWESAKATGHQMTDIAWVFHNYGPYVDDVINEVQSDQDFEIVQTYNLYGEPKQVIGLRTANPSISLSGDERQIIDRIVDDTKVMYWDAFIKHVYSTYPIKTQDRYSELNLVELATEYQHSNAAKVAM